MRAASGSCRCGQSSARVHGRYVRKLRDVAVGGLGVVIELRIRRFRCENTACTTHHVECVAILEPAEKGA
ncbi:transposase family protein [Streptomyces sp. NBC_01217]|uniref:transposase family protein n=1 Tax=Streptomyces sp. NBC_01217 TaxID=2903779 RepID=UPI002E0FE625|nr:transposase family protein [Streptomyces sp. NBC_01217]